MHRRILFVCAGNTCRSPMAAALAASAFPEATIESAGRSPGDAIAQNAIAVMREMTGTDISGARPRGVDEVDLSHFDLVVVLDRSVAEDLALDPRVARLVWDVPDPFGRTLDTYRRCAVDLRDRIEALADLRACSNGGNISWSARR